MPVINFEKIRLSEERKIRNTIIEDKSLIARLNKLKNDNELINHRYNLLQGALRITPDISPKLFEISKAVTDVLSLPNDLEVFVGLSNAVDDLNNAFVLPSKRQRNIYVYLDSHLVERSDPEEIAFILGHEVGHYLLNHHTFPSNLDPNHPDFSRIEYLELMRLKRRNEISADRCGFLCVQDFETASKALFKMTCGLSDKWVQFNGSWYMPQLKEINVLSEAVDDLETAMQSHPSPLIRTRCLWEFSQSALCCELMGNKSFQGTPLDEMEKCIEKWLRVTDTTLVKKYKAMDTHYSAKEYFLNAGIILCSDIKRKINKRAHRALYEFGSKIYNAKAKEIDETIDNFQARGEEILVKACEKNADVLLHKLSEKDRASIIHNLFCMIRQAKKLQQEDEDLLEMLQDSLYVSDEILKNLFDDLLEEAV